VIEGGVFMNRSRWNMIAIYGQAVVGGIGCLVLQATGSLRLATVLWLGAASSIVLDLALLAIAKTVTEPPPSSRVISRGEVKTVVPFYGLLLICAVGLVFFAAGEDNAELVWASAAVALVCLYRLAAFALKVRRVGIQPSSDE
jgi:hypothetical protein